MLLNDEINKLNLKGSSSLVWRLQCRILSDFIAKISIFYCNLQSALVLLLWVGTPRGVSM